MIRWKSKNPYINLFRESSRVLRSFSSDCEKIENMKQIVSHDFSGNWLYAHPSYKHLGNEVPQSGDACQHNPYVKFLHFARSVLNSEDSETSKLCLLSKEFAWVSSENSLHDWVATE